MNVQTLDAIELSNAASRLLSANTGAGHTGAEHLADALMSKAQKLLTGEVVAERKLEFPVLCAVLKELGLDVSGVDGTKSLTITVNPIHGYNCNVEVAANR